MSKIERLLNRRRKDLTLGDIIRALKALNCIYGNDSVELARAVGRFFDNFCRR